MKKIISLLAAVTVALLSVFTVNAQDSNVTYSGNSGNFIFAPGSNYSPTDLFTGFKSVMPGDSISQVITVKNNASNKVKVKIYMRSLGANQDSQEFLSQLHLKVQLADGNKTPYMFDAAANETASLTDWVCLGTLYSGGEVDLNVILDVPAELDNKYSAQIGYLDWEFMVEEYEIEATDPKTSDNSNIILWVAVALCSAMVIVFLIYKRKSQEK